ncbi:hypothetical protein RND71_005233 [Anisodus tanguticus]|uniref:Uncharacterized protein n=1 Tax=Anisodus tanguticus TaxID=243964 RepID=A0AAE1STQ7_9SOLA|nr:hypothetical protein RND71_005233 [Anisodus tanguticus]
MDEAEYLCDRIGIFVDGNFQCLGTTDEKFELPKDEVKISDEFLTVRQAKERFPVQSWGLADTTLEDVFIKVATEAQ